MDKADLSLVIVVIFCINFASAYIAQVELCICSEKEKCFLLRGKIQDDHFLSPLSHILDMRIPLKGLTLMPKNYCSGTHQDIKRFLFDLPILGFEVKPDCTGATVDFHIGVPGVGEAHVSGHGGTDGVDVGGKGTVAGVQLGGHAGVDSAGKPQGGISAGAGLGKYASGDVYLDAGADGVKAGVGGEASVPGGGPSAKGSVDYNFNNGKLTASGTVDSGAGPGACISGSTDVGQFMQKMQQHGLQSAVQDHIQSHGDSGTGFNPATFMQQAGMQNFQQNLMGRK